MHRAAADSLRAELESLPDFPLKLSEIEAHLGRPIRRHFNPEALVVPLKDGTSTNNGGNPVDHTSAPPDTPLVVELRSRYYQRYDKDRRFVEWPPFAADDPVVDLIVISDRYAHGPPPQVTAGTAYVGIYGYMAEHWNIAGLHRGYRLLLSHDLEVKPAADRWVYQLTTDRGESGTPEEIAEIEAMLIDYYDTIERGKDMPAHLAQQQQAHAENYEPGQLKVNLGLYNARYFDVTLIEGPHAGDFLRKDGHTRAFYLDFYVDGGARVPLPRFFRTLGFTTAPVSPREVFNVGAGLRDGGLLYYNEVIVKRGRWYVRATGFYPIENGKPERGSLDLSRFLVQSLTINYHVPLRGDK